VAITYKLLLMHRLERTYGQLKFFGSYFEQILPSERRVQWCMTMCTTLHISTRCELRSG
jgi:hypothetical protein